MKVLFKLFFYFAFLAFSATSYARIYYVAPTSANDMYPGTFTQPWASWQKAFNTARSGDTVYFRGGVYYPTDLPNTTSITAWNPSGSRGYNGTHDAPVCFFAYPPDYEAGNYPILDCYTASDPESGNMGIGVSGSYAHFKGLTVRNARMLEPGSNSGGIAVGTSGGYLKFENMTVHNNGGTGFSARYYDTLYVINCDSYNNCDSLDVENPGGDGDGFIISSHEAGTDTLTLTVLNGCRSWNNSDDNYDIGDTKQVHIDNCWSWGASSQPPPYDGDGTGYKISFSAVRADGKRWMRNCISAYDEYGIAEVNLYDPAVGPRMYFYNISIYKSEIVPIVLGPCSWSCYEDPAHDIYRNTLVYDYTYSNPVNFTEECHLTRDHNSWILNEGDRLGHPNPAFNITDDDFVSLDTAQLRYSRKPDGSLPDITFMKLKEGSDLIDKGIDVGLPYYGTAPDLGYSEFVLGSATISSPIFLNASIDIEAPTKLVINFNVTLNNIPPSTSAFIVTVNSVPRSVRSLVIWGSKVILTLSSPVAQADKITIAYSKPVVNELQTIFGGKAADFPPQPVINNYINRPPTISIFSPTKSTSFTSPATITIDAIAADIDGTIVKVEFYQGVVKLGEIVSEPYSFTWKDVSEGVYALTALATDNSGAMTRSSIVELGVDRRREIGLGNINLFPNPNNGMFSIEINPAILSANNSISIFSLAGKIVYDDILGEGENQISVDLGDISAGIYILSVSCDNSIVTTNKFVKE